MKAADDLLGDPASAAETELVDVAVFDRVEPPERGSGRIGAGLFLEAGDTGNHPALLDGDLNSRRVRDHSGACFDLELTGTRHVGGKADQRGGEEKCRLDV